MIPLHQYVNDRIHKYNNSFNIAITGATGSGKSYSALRIASVFDPNFKIEQVVFGVEDCVKLINSDTLGKGSVILFEEAGVSLNNRKWQSDPNTLMNFIMQTIRHKNYIFIFTTPDLGFIDNATRKLFHCHMMTEKINVKEQCVQIKPYLLSTNQRTGKIYYKYLKYTTGEEYKKLVQLDVKKPTVKLIHQYEKLKLEFTSNLTREIEEKLSKKDKPKFTENDILYHKIIMGRELGTAWLSLCERLGITVDRGKAIVKRRENVGLSS